MRTQDVFKALSDPTRRQVLKLLQRGSKSAGELAGAFDVTKAAMSHHFNVLKAADLVRTERRGQQIVYSLNTTVMQDVAARESTQHFYKHDEAWLEEVFTEEDFMIMEWRKIASQHNRGIQPPSRMD